MKIPDKAYRIVINLLARAIRAMMKANGIKGHFCVGAENAFFEVEGLRLQYHYEHFGSGGNIDSGGSSEPQTRHKLACYLREQSAFYDIGAHEGLFSLDMCRRSNSVIVHAFEPQPKALRENIALNGADRRIVVHDVALGDQQGSVSMTVHDRSSNHVTNEAGSIPLVRIDDLDLPAPGAIKIDVEGFELNVLRGARQTLLSHRPVVVTEINHCFRRYNSSLKPMYDLMESCGYSFKRLLESGELVDIAERPDLPEDLPPSAEDNYWWVAASAC